MFVPCTENVENKNIHICDYFTEGCVLNLTDHFYWDEEDSITKGNQSLFLFSFTFWIEQKNFISNVRNWESSCEILATARPPFTDHFNSCSGWVHKDKIRCTILIRYLFPVQIKRIQKWNTCLCMSLGCTVHHLAGTVQPREYTEMEKVFTFAHEGWWNMVQVRECYTRIRVIFSKTMPVCWHFQPFDWEQKNCSNPKKLWVGYRPEAIDTNGL